MDVENAELHQQLLDLGESLANAQAHMRGEMQQNAERTGQVEQSAETTKAALRSQLSELRTQTQKELAGRSVAHASLVERVQEEKQAQSERIGTAVSTLQAQLIHRVIQQHYTCMWNFILAIKLNELFVKMKVPHS
jgi:hypothetical protein